MRRKPQGRYVLTTTSGEKVRAFVPDPLPPKPPIDWTPDLVAAQQRAAVALGRLDGVSRLLPEPALFLYAYVRKEAVLSSQIEGTQSSLSDLLAYENDQAPGVPLDDVAEVSSYVAALDHGLKRMRGGFPLSLRLIREIHKALLSTGRGHGKQPGEFRKSQNWLGGTRPGNAAFVPPPWEELAASLSAWERFLHGEPVALDPLTRAALAHVQFESLHPFLDGNGRVGRLVIVLLLIAEGLLSEPMLYLSLYLKQHRARYYELLQKVRLEGDWESWLAFFYDGIAETSDNAVATAERLLKRFERDRAKLQAGGKVSGSLLRVHHCLQVRPVATASAIAKAEGLAIATVNKALEQLSAAGLVKELTGGLRYRLYAYTSVLKILEEGIQA
ncbi:MAG: Fic family protein [Holophagaceae bacterium]